MARKPQKPMRRAIRIEDATDMRLYLCHPDATFSDKIVNALRGAKYYEGKSEPQLKVKALGIMGAFLKHRNLKLVSAARIVFRKEEYPAYHLSDGSFLIPKAEKLGCGCPYVELVRVKNGKEIDSSIAEFCTCNEL